MRLTISTRQALVSIMVKQMFEKREQDVKEQRLKMGDEIYRRVVHPFARALRRLPEGWARKGSYLNVVAGRVYNNNPSTQRHLSVPLSKPCLLPIDVIQAEIFDVVTRRLLERQEKLDLDLREERSRRDFQLRAILADCNSTEELIERWPEVAPVVERYERNSFMTPPRRTQIDTRGRTKRIEQPERAVNLKELNVALGLGKKRASW